MKTFQLFIGANNETKKLETAKISRIVSKTFPGFTLQRGIGYWEGKQEKTAIVTIATDKGNEVTGLAGRLRVGLGQDAVLLTESGKSKIIS